MPTEVEVPGEAIFEFPDEVGESEIQSILRQRFPVESTEPFVPATPRQPIPPEQLTTYGGPPKQLASAAETLVEPVEEMMNPRVTLPRIPIKESDPLYLTAGKEAVNVLAGIPEFMSSNVGLAGMVGGAVAPVATSAAFTADLLNSLGHQVRDSYKNWDKMTPTEKTTAVVDMAGTGAFAALLGGHTAKGVAEKIIPTTRVTTKFEEKLPSEPSVIADAKPVEPVVPAPEPQPTILAPEKTDVVEPAIPETKPEISPVQANPVVEAETVKPDKLQVLTEKVESGQKLTAAEKKQYLKLRDEATEKAPELAQAQVSVGPGAAAPLDVAAESAAQAAATRTAEYINRSAEGADIKTQPDISVPEADLKMSDPQVEARWNAAKLSQKSPIEKAKEAVTAAKNAMTRHFRFLDPKTDGVVTDILRVHENDPLHAKFLASQVMRGITEGLKPKKYDVFSRIVILKDLVKYGEQFGQDLADLPFGYKSWDAVKNDLSRFEALAEKYPDIKESLRRRDEFMGALRYDLVSRGLLSEKVKDFDEYFHHQVLQYMALKEPVASTGSSDVRTHGKTWQKGRTGMRGKDYNTSYLESEFEVISQAFAQMATQDTLKQLKNAADISDQLKAIAKEARANGQDVTWEQLIPEDHIIWQPEQGNHFYWANSITEKALDAYLKGQKQLTEADIKEVLAMGQKKEQWVIPKRLAKTLDDFKPQTDHAVEKAIGAGISQWKRWTLFNPMRNVIYELNNLSGDADIAFAVDPKIFKYAPQAAKEVAQFVRAKKGASKEMSDLVRLGVIDSGFSVQELPDLKGNQFFRALEGKDPSLTQRYWENVLDFNRWREGILRLSAYRRAMELLNDGKKPYWTSKQSEMDALYKDANVTREQIAAKLAREAIGDYGNISYAGQWIRSKLIPFYSWMEINAPRYVRLMQNASREEGSTARVAGVAGKKVVTQSAKLAARMSAFYFLANLWNRSMFPEEDKELNSTRDQFHVILHRNADGSITSLRLQGAFSDALSWFGAQDLIKDVKDVKSGLATPKEKAIEMAKAPVNKIAQASLPIYKTLFEAAVKKQTYPDVFNPRPIRDSKAHIARMVSLGSVYDYLAKHPQRPGTWTLKALATYTTEPGEAAYMTAKSIVADKLKEMNVERPGAEPTAKSNALYYWKQSIRYKNPKLEEYWRNRYIELGGKSSGMDSSLRNTSPYNGVSQKNRGQFESLLSPAEKDIMQRADDWYRKVYIER